MPTGLQAYDALRAKTKTLPHGAPYEIHPLDAYDLAKLKPSDLDLRGFDHKIAEKVSSALLDEDFGALGQHMGIELVVSPHTPRLLPENEE